MEKYAIIVAGGEGNRAGGSVPKQFRPLGGVPMLWWSVRAFHREDPDTHIILVLHPGFFDDWEIMHAELPEADRKIEYKIVCGGRSRLESVKNGLMSVADSDEALVAIHDAARPLVDAELIKRGWSVASHSGAAVPAVPLSDSIRHLEKDGDSRAEIRSDYVAVQTPQVFKARILKESYDQPLNPGMTDDASVAEAAGYKVRLYEGGTYNMKVTHPLDFDIAATLLNELRNKE